MQKIPHETVRKALKLKTNESIKRIWGCTLEAAVNDKGKGTLIVVGIHVIEWDPGYIRLVRLNRFCSIQQRHIGDYSIGRWKLRNTAKTV